MKLKVWLKVNKKTQAWFALKLKTNQGHVSELANDKVDPKIETIARINKITKGDVSYLDWGTK